jgi:hypothetical protein
MAINPGGVMKATWVKSLVLLGAVALQSHAIVGVGVQWDPAELTVHAASGIISPAGSTQQLTLEEKGTSGAQGFGVKLWVDAIPFVNLELTENVQFANYNVSVVDNTTGDSTAVKFDSPFPFLKGTPFTARSFTDVAVLYPFLKLPPLVNLVSVYAGAGLSYGVSTPTLTPNFAKTALANAQKSGSYNPTTSDEAAAQSALVSAIQNASLNQGVGWFLQVGTHLKVPVIPIAFYADAKYRFAGINPELVSEDGFSLELGAALAF